MSYNSKWDEKNSIKIFFNNHKAVQHFMSWLDNQGEQDYWMWMEEREQKEGGNITAVRFEYDHKMLAIFAHCSRIDKNEKEKDS